MWIHITSVQQQETCLMREPEDGPICVSKHVLFCFFPRCSHTWELAPALEYRVEFPQFPDQGQSVGHLGRAISSSQGLYLYINTEKRTHIHKHYTSMP
jgi:hypothetical protein